MSDLLTVPELDTRQKREDYSALLDDLKRGWHARLVVGQAKQISMARQLALRDEVFIEGLGQRTMCVSSEIYWDMVRRYGQDCWADKGFRKDMMRDEPALRAHAKPRNLTVQALALTR
jgi:hypothetical protein